MAASTGKKNNFFKMKKNVTIFLISCVTIFMLVSLKIRSRLKGRVYATALFIIPIILCFAVFPYESAYALFSGKHFSTPSDSLQVLRHIFISLSAPFTFMSLVAVNHILKEKGFYFGFIGGIIGIIGTIFLVMDQGSYWLSRALLQSLEQGHTNGLALHLGRTIEEIRTNLFYWPVLLLPFGVIIQSIGLVREKHIRLYQSLLICLAVLLLFILPVQSLLWISPLILGVALMPLGIRVLQHSESLLREI